jgi:hypothetical protein
MRTRIVGVAIATALVGLYTRVLRKSILNWGATDEETSARLPGDELLEHADGVSTRAIDIDGLSPSECSRGVRRMATGSGRSCSSRETAARD